MRSTAKVGGRDTRNFPLCGSQSLTPEQGESKLMGGSLIAERNARKVIEIRTPWCRAHFGTQC